MDELLVMKNISKDFSSTKALDNVCLSVSKGQIHGLLGENGAGKTTLMNILSGNYPYGSYEGELFLRGKECRFFSSKDSERSGIAIIHQELSLIQGMSIADNIFLGNEKGNGFFIDRKKNYVLYKEEPPSTPPEPPSERPSEPTDFALVAEPVAKPTPPSAKSKFKKPDVFEVAAYCRERQNGIDAQAFVDFYESKGWMIGKNPMKDWKAAVRTWERQRNTPPSTADPTKFYNPEPTDWSKLGQTYDSSPLTAPTTTPAPQTF